MNGVTVTTQRQRQVAELLREDISRILRETNTIARRVGLGTGPNVFYIVGDSVGRNPETQG